MYLFVCVESMYVCICVCVCVCVCVYLFTLVDKSLFPWCWNGMVIACSFVCVFASPCWGVSTVFREPYPARVAFEVKGLPKGAQVEIDAIALQRE